MNKTLGILGGMGADAGAYMLMEALRLTRRMKPVMRDEDYPSIVLYNLPIQDFDERGIVSSDSVKKQVIDSLKRLADWPCDYILIGCNTVYAYLDEFQDMVQVPIIDIVGLTVASLTEATVGVLSSSKSRDMGLYRTRIQQSRGLEVVEPNSSQQREIDRAIAKVISGSAVNGDRLKLREIVNSLLSQGAKQIILGCTELPLLLKPTSLPIIDAGEVALTHTLSLL